MIKDLILGLYKEPQTVFSLKEISLLFPEISPPNLKRRLHYFVKVGKINRVRRGIYTKEKYDLKELANKLYAPSYISFETVLQEEGMIFQYYKSTYLASYLSRDVAIKSFKFVYRKIKSEILLNREGVEERENYFIATTERAFLDTVFLFKDYYFDNLGSLDWEKVARIKKIYKSKTLEKRVKEYYKIYIREYAKR